MFNKTWINRYRAWAAEHLKNFNLEEYLPVEPYPALCKFNENFEELMEMYHTFLLEKFISLLSEMCSQLFFIFGLSY